jgi:putative phosphoesterase
MFSGVSRILHAGDVGAASVLAALNEIAPTEAVYGNVDDPHNPALARERVVSLEGVTIHVSHGHELGRPTAELVASRYGPKKVSDTFVLVFGHTHRAVIARPHPHVLVVNPGAAGPRRFDLQPSVARLTITDGSAECEIISLA